jgi:hypothetical protein
MPKCLTPEATSKSRQAADVGRRAGFIFRYNAVWNHNAVWNPAVHGRQTAQIGDEVCEILRGERGEARHRGGAGMP